MADFVHVRFVGTRIDGQPTIEQGTSDTIPTTSRPAAAGATQYYDRVAGSQIQITGGVLVGHIFNFDGTNWDGALNVDSTFSDAADAGGDIVKADVTTPAADDPAGVHALYATGVSVDFPGPFTSPVVPRNASVTYDALYDGGDTTITGTDMADAACVEVIADNPGATVYGTKVFKTVTAATQQNLGAGGVSASIGWGHKLGLAVAPKNNFGQCTKADLPEAAVFDNASQSYGFTPTNLPDGTTLSVQYVRAGVATSVTPTL